MAADQGNLEMVKYCVANKCPINEFACANAAKNGHLECLKYLREEVKAPWDSETAAWAAANGHLHILEYLVERKYDQYSVLACRFAAQRRSLRLFEVLTRNRQMALGLSGRSRSAREQPHRLCTIPPRQRLSITIWLAIRKRRVTRRDRIRIRIKLNVITRPAHTYAHQKILQEEKKQAHETSEKSPPQTREWGTRITK